MNIVSKCRSLLSSPLLAGRRSTIVISGRVRPFRITGIELVGPGVAAQSLTNGLTESRGRFTFVQVSPYGRPGHPGGFTDLIYGFSRLEPDRAVKQVREWDFVVIDQAQKEGFQRG